MEKLTLPVMMYKESGHAARGTKKAHNVVPTWNHLYDIVRNKKVLGKWAKRHKEKIEVLTRNWMEENEWQTTINQKVYVDMWVYWPDAVERDCHNIDKLLMDAFEDAGIYDNDANALLRFQDFDLDVESPRIEVLFSLGQKFDRKEVVAKQRADLKDK